MDDLLGSRWRGQAGRAEIWYTTITDPQTGTGFWLHHEVVSPAGGAAPFTHGLVGVFAPDGPPVMARFGPQLLSAPNGPAVFACDEVMMTAGTLTGAAGDISWDVTFKDDGPAMFTFPRWAWRTGLLPGAQIVPAPAASHHGVFRVAGHTLVLSDAPGATGHIYGHGMARMWAWLHADLGGGDVVEIVAAVAKRALWRHLPVLPFVRLRLAGVDLPAGDPLLAALRMRAQIDLPQWTVTGRIGAGRRLRVIVYQDPDRTLRVPFTDPDGSHSVCHNTERADADILVEHQQQGHWLPERHWKVSGTAHAEVGLR